MRLISNTLKLSSLTLALCFMVLSLSPVAVSAASSGNSSNFCSVLSADNSTQMSNLTSKENALTTALSTRKSNMVSNWASWDQKLAADQATWSQNRQAQFNALAAEAKTSAETTAVQTFENSLESAINTREAANATVRTTYRNGVLALLTAEQSTLSSQEATLTSSVKSAVSTAESLCAASPSSAPVTQATLLAQIATAQKAFQQAVSKDNSDLKSQSASLENTLQANTQANHNTFLSAEQSALNTLKAAF